LPAPYGRAAYRDAGSGGARETLLLIHGAGLQSAAWLPQMTAIAETHRVIAVDMPGHGSSEPLPQSSAQLPDFIAWLHEVVTALQLESVNIAGHSMGALIAAGYACEHPQQTARVAVVNSVYRRSAQARAAVETRADEILDSTKEVDIDTPLGRWFGDEHAAVRKQVAEWLRAMDRQSYATVYRAFARSDDTYAEAYSTITCPLLALTGGDDANSTPAMSEAIAQAAVNGVAKVIPHHRHLVNLTAPEEVTAALKEWLTRPLAQRGGANQNAA